MSYYFTNEPGKKPNRKKISFRFLGNLETFVSDDGVFSKSTLDFGSRVLLETIINIPLNGKLLDLGCGLGYMGIMLKKYQPLLNVTMSDVNETATALAKENSELYHQDNTVVISDGFENIKEMFDCIICNPPIRTGKNNIYRLLTDAINHLNENGVMYIVIRKQQGAASAINYLNSIAETEVINKKNGYWIICVRLKENK